MVDDKRVTMDFETRSKSNLKKEGAYKYSLDPSTQPTCLAFKIKGNPTVYFLPFEVINRHWRDQSVALQELWVHQLLTKGYLFCAHNAFFETCIYKNILVKRYGWPDIPFNRFRCTAAKAASCALPRNLEGAGMAMRLTTQKDKMGYVAMMKTCKPTKQWVAWDKINKQKAAWTKRENKILEKGEPPMFLEPEAAPDVWAALYKYCKIDVRSEELLDESLPDLIPLEQEIWFLNQKLNWRGLPIDIPTVEKITKIMAVESKKKLKELDSLTMGLVTKPGARKSILEFLALDDVILPDIRANTVDEVLKNGDLSDDMRRLLEIRKSLSKTSTRKYQSFLDRAMPDGRVRDILLYHGASTGRDTGTGIQPHNFPRGVLALDKDRPYEAVENVIECDEDMLKILYGETLPVVFSSILRNMIVPPPGHELFVADFSKIEVAVLWWITGNKKGLEILKSGKDPYIYMAAANTGKTYKEVEVAIENDEKWAVDARQLGKAQVLGCGFGMGWEKFLSTAWTQYRLKLTEDQAFDAVKSYRKSNEPVPEFWYACQDACIAVLMEGKDAAMAGRCKFHKKNGFLWIELPSGRRLAYRDPSCGWKMISMDRKALVRNGEVLMFRSDGVGERKEEYLKLKALPGVEEKTVKDWREKRTVEFMAVNSKTKKWSKERTWGGSLTENIVQAVARDLMMPAMLRLEKRGYQAALMVHDEGLTFKPIGEGSVDEFTKIMCERPKWGDENLIVEAKGWKGPRYRK